MNRHCQIGLESCEGYDVGRDPRAMTTLELETLGHVRVSPLRALRLKCLDCCNGSAPEVRLCPSVDCPSWPFRMAKNLWSGPVSAARREHGRRLGLERVAKHADAFSEKEQTDASDFDRLGVPNDTAVASHPAKKDVAEGGAS
ncbi:hypothetical protein [Pseudogemmobacter sp. W21_MBD1_M6]|uniref:hypothetical protein n=1 Tax=Pseudogemmobacter sp. W21_MBD1_M6 TaxID=3240271 RepID=UPI003F94F896